MFKKWTLLLLLLINSITFSTDKALQNQSTQVQDEQGEEKEQKLLEQAVINRYNPAAGQQYAAGMLARWFQTASRKQYAAGWLALGLFQTVLVYFSAWVEGRNVDVKYYLFTFFGPFSLPFILESFIDPCNEGDTCTLFQYYVLGKGSKLSFALLKKVKG